MEIIVPDSIIKMTKKCPHEFSCLDVEQNTDQNICEVDYADGTHVLFLKTNPASTCPYHVQFGYGHVCTCPTHFAIHKNYKP